MSLPQSARAVIDNGHKYFNTRTHQKRVQATEQAQREEAEAHRQRLLELEQTLKGWLQSDIGSYFLDRIEADKKKALKALIEVGPSDTEAVRAAQTKIQMLDTINRYISEVLLTGRMARNGNK